MGRETLISWCHSTVNPTSGCDGCELWTPHKGGPCYAGNLHQIRLAKAMPNLYDKDFSNVRTIAGRMKQAASWGAPSAAENADKPWFTGFPRGPTMIEMLREGQWVPIRFRSLRIVKSWATRNHHVYRTEKDVLIVSAANGLIWRYREKKRRP